VLDCGAIHYGSIDNYEWLYDHAQAPKLDPKACQVDTPGSGKCKSLVYKDSYCILHFLLIAQQRDAAQWVPLAVGQAMPRVCAALPKGPEIAEKAKLSLLRTSIL